jgi:hypothetical protein
VVAMVVLLALRWRGAVPSLALLLLPLLAIGAAGTKGSALPVVVAGVFVALLGALLFRRPLVVRVLVDFLVVAGCLLLTVVVVFHGSEAGLHIDLPAAAEQSAGPLLRSNLPDSGATAFLIVFTVLAVLSRGVGMLALPFDRRERQDPVTWLLIGGSLAGAGALGVFAHPGSSQWYFALSAIPLMALGSTLGLASVLSSLGLRPLLVGALLGPLAVVLPVVVLGPLTVQGMDHAAALVLAAVLVLLLIGVVAAVSSPVLSEPRLRLGLRPGFRVAGAAVVAAVLTAGAAVAVQAISTSVTPVRQPVSVDDRLATSRNQIEAARWIRDHSDVDDLVMTNRHCTTPVRPRGCDSRHWTVAAFTERQVLVEGWTATPMSASLAPEGRDSITVDYWKPELLELNDRFIANPSADAAEELRSLGVDWVYVDHTRPFARTLEPYATLRYSNRGVDVYEL